MKYLGNCLGLKIRPNTELMPTNILIKYSRYYSLFRGELLEEELLSASCRLVKVMSFLYNNLVLFIKKWKMRDWSEQGTEQ